MCGSLHLPKFIFSLPFKNYYASTSFNSLDIYRTSSLPAKLELRSVRERTQMTMSFLAKPWFDSIPFFYALHTSPIGSPNLPYVVGLKYTMGSRSEHFLMAERVSACGWSYGWWLSQFQSHCQRAIVRGSPDKRKRLSRAERSERWACFRRGDGSKGAPRSFGCVEAVSSRDW